MLAFGAGHGGPPYGMIHVRAQAVQKAKEGWLQMSTWTLLGDEVQMLHGSEELMHKP